MEETCEAGHLLAFFPPEILVNIFKFLPAKSLTRFREVNSMWCAVIDDLSKNEEMWREYCKHDFTRVYQVARRKAKPGLTWFGLYRSLSMWRLLKTAAEEREYLNATSCSPLTEIRNFQTLNNGIIGVLQEGSINYYDIDTLSLSHLPPLMGDYSKYAENEHCIVVLSTTLHVHVIRKLATRKYHEIPSLTYNNVKQFSLVDLEVYFVSFLDEILLCDLRTQTLEVTFLGRLTDRIMSIGYSDGHFNVLTLERQILAYVGSNFVIKAKLCPFSSLIHQLYQYRLLAQMDWRVYFQWMYELQHMGAPDGFLKDIKIIKRYADVYFVGSCWGVFRIYYSPSSEREFNILTTEPMKQYYFMKPEVNLSAVVCMYPILHVDAVEKKDGHKVVVAMPKKIVVLTFTHDFKTETSRKYSALSEKLDLSEFEDLDMGAVLLGAPGTSRRYY